MISLRGANVNSAGKRRLAVVCRSVCLNHPVLAGVATLGRKPSLVGVYHGPSGDGFGQPLTTLVDQSI
jgi:hypothetical protein